MTQTTKTYSVWVGGVEVNDYPLDYAQATSLADQFTKDGYDDVAIELLPE